MTAIERDLCVKTFGMDDSRFSGQSRLNPGAPGTRVRYVSLGFGIPIHRNSPAPAQLSARQRDDVFPFAMLSGEGRTEKACWGVDSWKSIARFLSRLELPDPTCFGTLAMQMKSPSLNRVDLNLHVLEHDVCARAVLRCGGHVVVAAVHRVGANIGLEPRSFESFDVSA